MRILIAMPQKGSQGGPAACEPPFNDELRRLGHNVEEFVYAYADTNSGLLKRTSRVRRTARNLRNLIRSTEFDVVHINTSFDTKALIRDSVVLSCLPSKTKVFLKFHGSDARLLKTLNPVLRRLVRYVLARADAIGVLSSEERNNFLKAGTPAEKIFVVKNVVAPVEPTANKNFKSGLALQENVPLLLFIGRFIEAKGLMDVIAACARLRQQNRDFTLVCVGDGPAREDSEAEVERLGLGSHVRFVGYVPEETASQFYANSTMLLFPTYHYEGFPMVIFNAAAAGLPIITTRIRAAADQLSEPENCLWVKAKNPAMLAERIEKLLDDERLRAKMGMNNRSLSKNFSAQLVTLDYVRAYESITQ